MAGAIGYARVSTDEQAKKNNSLPAQKQRISAYCGKFGLTLLNTFEGSESGRTMERPRLQEMLAYCRAHRGKVSSLVVTDLSRLARNLPDQAHIIMTLQKLGITFVSIDEPMTGDSAVGQFLRNMLGSVNQLFSDTLSERTRSRMQAAVKSGRFPWPAPIGYVNKNKQIQPDPERAALVRESFELMASGRYPTADAVLKVVTAMGLKTKKGRKVTKQTFARMLSNPVYAGWVVSGDIRARGIHEPLIFDDLFERVQARLKGRNLPNNKLNSDFPLRGVVHCAKCRRPLTAGFAKGRKKRYPRYWCWTPGCRAVGIGRDELERHFVALLSQMEPTAELLKELPDRIAENWRKRKERIASEAARLTRRLFEQGTLNQKAIFAKLNNEIGQEDFELVKKEIAEETERIQAQISTLDSERDTMQEMLEKAEADLLDLVSAWNKGNVNQRQELARAFFPKGLFFSHEKKFFEPANTVITAMVMRWLKDFIKVGVPDGI